MSKSRDSQQPGGGYGGGGGGGEASFKSGKTRMGIKKGLSKTKHLRFWVGKEKTRKYEKGKENPIFVKSKQKKTSWPEAKKEGNGVSETGGDRVYNMQEERKREGG